MPGSREDSTTAITYLFFRPEVSFQKQTELARAFADRYVNEPGDHLVGVTGVVAARTTQLRLLRGHLPTVELVTVAVVFLIVALTFRSVGTPLMTLGTAAVGLVLVLRMAAWIGQALGLSVPSELEPVLVALLLGVVTDYSIFFLAGLREGLARGIDRLEAARRSTAEFGPVVMVAGLTVAGGCLALLAAELGLFRAFGPGMALTILIALAVAMTLVPACMAIFGRVLFWPWRGPPRVPRPSARARPRPLTQAVVRRPLLVAVACAGVTILLALPLTDIRFGLDVVGSLPPHTQAARAAEAAARGFSPGVLSPTVVLVEGRGIVRMRAGLARLQELIERQPGVAAVLGPRQNPTGLNLGAVLSTTGDAARYLVTLDSAPLGGEAIEDVANLRRQMPRLMQAAGIPGAEAHLVGDSAIAEAIVTQTQRDIGRIAVVALAVGFLLLVLFLRALVAPLYLLVTNVLALAATLGLTTLIFQDVAGHGGITFYVPLAAAVLLIALGSDYNIFGVGYIWHEARRRSLRDAIAVALPRSSRTISAAGVTLAASFAVLALVPLVPFREFAFAMAAGIAIDVFLVRSLFVPALVGVVGPASAWPGRFFSPPVLPKAGVYDEPPQEAEPTPARRRRSLRLLAPGAVAVGLVVWRLARRAVRARKRRRIRL